MKDNNSLLAILIRSEGGAREGGLNELGSWIT